MAYGRSCLLLAPEILKSCTKRKVTTPAKAVERDGFSECFDLVCKASQFRQERPLGAGFGELSASFQKVEG